MRWWWLCYFQAEPIHFPFPRDICQAFYNISYPSISCPTVGHLLQLYNYIFKRKDVSFAVYFEIFWTLSESCTSPSKLEQKFGIRTKNGRKKPWNWQGHKWLTCWAWHLTEQNVSKSFTPSWRWKGKNFARLEFSFLPRCINE